MRLLAVGCLFVLTTSSCSSCEPEPNTRDTGPDTHPADTESPSDTHPSDTHSPADTAPDPDTAADTTAPRDMLSDTAADTADATDTRDPADSGPQNDTPDGDGWVARGESIGTFTNTYYYLSDESEYSGPDDTTLYDKNCQPLVEVPTDYADDVCIEGSGRLEDGTVINYASTCSCGRPCPTGGTVCYKKLDASKYPWGEGSRGNALEPLRSWAVDTSVIAFGKTLYVPKWDGVEIPKVGELGGFTHDGCFRADDVGGGIDGKHYDFFAGTPAMWQKLEGIYPTRTNFEVYANSPRCPEL